MHVYDKEPNYSNEKEFLSATRYTWVENLVNSEESFNSYGEPFDFVYQ